jgi:uncharacterized iron-regulated protein
MKRLSHPATLIAAAALFMALGGGAYAAAAKLISGSQIKNHSIPEKKLTAAAISDLRGKPATAYSTYTLSPVGLSTGAATVRTLTLGAGSYIVFAKTLVYNNTTDDAIDCFLDSPTSDTIDAGSASFHKGTLAIGENEINMFGPLTTSGGDVTVQCNSSGNIGSSAVLTHITAIKVASISGH